MSRASQLFVTQLLEPERVRQARDAVAAFFGQERRRYAQGLSDLGFELYTGDGGFYHWARLPNGQTADAFNERLFRHSAGILPGRLCDMKRRAGSDGPLDRFIRFSFGPLAPETYESNLQILSRCV